MGGKTDILYAKDSIMFSIIRLDWICVSLIPILYLGCTYCAYTFMRSRAESYYFRKCYLLFLGNQEDIS